jgi:hypothetical protein
MVDKIAEFLGVALGPHVWLPLESKRNRLKKVEWFILTHSQRSHWSRFLILRHLFGGDRQATVYA